MTDDQPSDRQAELGEFGSGQTPGQCDASETDDGAPTSAENARDIEHLVGVVEELTDQVGTLTEALGQHGPANQSSETDLRGIQ